MNVFVVIFTDQDGAACAKAAKILQDKFTDYELVADRVYLVRHEGLTSEIAEAAGIKSDPRVATGVVFKLNHAYAGYTARTLWEWLED